MHIDTDLKFAHHSLWLQETDIVGMMINENSYDHRVSLYETWYKVNRLKHLFFQGIVAGWENWSWKRAEDEGWLCRNDYDVYDDLKDFEEPK